MSFRVAVRSSAEKELGRLSSHAQRRIADVLLDVGEQPFPRGVKKWKGSDGYRIRVGDYRILCTIDNKKNEVSVYAVGHKKEVCR